MADIEIESKSQQTPPSKSQKLSVFSQTILRILVIATTLAATWIIVSAKQSVEILGLTLDARYSYSPAFKFFALANAIACGFCLLSLILLCVSSRQKQNHAYYILFLHDLLMMSLVLGGCAAATAIGYVGKYGNTHSGWLPICDHFGEYCHRVTTSVALSYLGLLCLLLLTIFSATNSRKSVR